MSEGFQERDRRARARAQARNVAEIQQLEGPGSDARLRRLHRQFESASRRRGRGPNVRLALMSLATFTGVLLAGLYGPGAAAWVTRALQQPEPPSYVRDCGDAHRHNLYNIPAGAPAYRPELDSDDDGWACEGLPSIRLPWR